jgi:hypothetical protein
MPECDPNQTSRNHSVENMTYQIRLKDHLDACWHDWFDGWTITNLEDGEVLLTSVSVDQSALHGTLNKIRDLNLKLISVVEVDQPQSMEVQPESNIAPMTESKKAS